jgi:hypothetical protein
VTPHSPTLSIVAPIFNVEEWLVPFLESMLAQTFADWEAILVVDGSPDGSLAIARDFARQDDRFVVLDCVNGGVGSARNRGLALTRGEYLAFADPDDLLHPDAYAVLVRSLAASGSDIAIGRAEHFTEDDVHSGYWTQRSPVFAAGGVGLTLADSPDLILDHAPWTKVFRASMFRSAGLRFPEGTLCEDLVLSVQAFRAAQTIDVVLDTVYYHRGRRGAITSDLMIEPILSDWMTQAGVAAALVDTLNDASRDAHYFRFLNQEVWTRVRAFDQLPDAATFARFETFVADMLDAASPTVRGSLPQLKRSMLQFLASGRCGVLWPQPGVPSPFANDLSTGTRARRAVVAASTLELDNEVDMVLRAVLTREFLLQPLLGYRGGLTEVDFVEACRLIHTVWPDGPTPVEQARLSPSEVLLLISVDALDETGFRFIVDNEMITADATANRLSVAAPGLSVSGTLTLTAPLATDAAVQLILRSRGSGKVRAFPVEVSPHDSTPFVSLWVATVRPTQGMVGDEWNTWLRIDRPGLGRHEAPLQLSPSALPTDSPVVSDGVVAAFGSEKRAVIRLTVHSPPDPIVPTARLVRLGRFLKGRSGPRIATVKPNET